MKFTEQIIQEAIELSKARQYVKGWDKDRLKDWFDNKYRVYLDLEKGEAASKDIESELEQEVKKALSNSDFEVKDFKKGMAYDTKNKREVKLGKILGRVDKELLQKFANDPNREASKVSKPIVVISRHPYDIAGQSYKRGWTSCKDFSRISNENSRFVKDEAHSTLIAYLIYKDDKNINKPIARVLINQYFNNQGENAYVPQFKSYGSAGVWEEAFKETIQKWLDKKQGKKIGKFKLNPLHYQDSLSDEITLSNLSEGDAPDWVIKSKNTPLKFTWNKEKENGFVWKNGTWEKGTWEGGIWEGGDWQNGAWKNGLWKNGKWYNGVWMNGNWEDGEWADGVWKNGIWENGVWESGAWEDGGWYDGLWKDGNWLNGLWKRGDWKDGFWKNGTWQDGEWADGLWKNGTWRDGIWRGGTWMNGTWKGGLWKDGTWEDGIWEDGVWENGEWREGTWKRGVWRRGTWFNGTWETGEWEKGTWKKGLWKKGTWHEGAWEGGTWVKGFILDTKREGNFEKDWEWDGDFVLSKLNPKDYFSKRN